MSTVNKSINPAIFSVFLASLMVILFVVTGCKKFLSVEPPTAKVPFEFVFDNENNANSAVVGMYLDMYQGTFAGGGVGSLSWITGLSADELHNNPQTDALVIQLESNEILPNNTFIDNLWADMYKPVYQANAIVEGLERSSGVSISKKRQFKGEALFVRAFCHFYLVNLFGDIPLVLTTDYQVNKLLHRSSREDIYTQIETDLLSADSLLTEDYPTNERVRPNRATAKALLSRLYLFRGDWLKAAEKSTDIISQTTPPYGLSADLNYVFLNSSIEAIWQLKPADRASYTNEGFTFLQNPANGNILRSELFSAFSNTDKRRIDWITTSGMFHSPYKYKLFSFSTSPSTEYSIVFRLAEQFLIRAEARAQLGFITGNNSALSDVNQIRRRVGLADTTATTLASIMGVIENERKLELFSEWGHRWLDLKRWKKANQILSTLKSNWHPTDTLFPIPQIEINKNLNLKPQNPGY